ncbi:MAG TPA: hypothetical protein VIJ16_02885, partial [Gemmatimonadaceae bacterium]
LAAMAEPMARYPLAFGHLMGAADMAVHGAVELAILGDPNEDDFRALAGAAARQYVPSLVLAGAAPGASDLPLLSGRPLKDGRATAYLCRAYACDAPVNDARLLGVQLENIRAE